MISAISPFCKAQTESMERVDRLVKREKS